jgi:hypothetical protein
MKAESNALTNFLHPFSYISRAGFYPQLQFYTLIAGAIFFIMWRLIVIPGAGHAA